MSEVQQGSHAVSPSSAPVGGGGWSTPRRLALFATFIFVVLFTNAFPLGDIPFTAPIAAWWRKIWEHVVPWVADHVLRLGSDAPNARTGGESTREFIRVGCAATLAIVGGSAWALFDRHRTNPRKLNEWLHLYLRLYLVAELFSYGLGKVLANQFSALGPERLSQAVGEMSPSSLLWTFMGYSVPYQVFAGLGEVIAGVFLCFRRTTTIGALIGVAIMSNVVMLNFAYDVGVKLHSTFNLLALLFLAAPDLQRLLEVFVLNRPTVPRAWALLYASPWKNRVVVAASGLFCAYLFATELRYNRSYYLSDGRGAAKPPLYGLYEVETIRQNGVTTSTAPVDSARWSRLVIGESRSSVRLASGRLAFYTASVDTAARHVRFTLRDDPAVAFTLGYSRQDTGQLLLRGWIGQDSIEMHLARRDEMAYRLTQRPFHWTYDKVESR